MRRSLFQRPSPRATRTTDVVELTFLWQGTPLWVHHASDTQSPGAIAHLAPPFQLLADRVTFEGTQPEVRIDADDVPFDALYVSHEDGQTRPVESLPARAFAARMNEERYPLPERVCLHIVQGDVEVTYRRVPPVAAVGVGLEAFDLKESLAPGRYIVGAAFVFGLALLTSALAPPEAAGLSLDLDARSSRLIDYMQVNMPPPAHQTVERSGEGPSGAQASGGPTDPGSAGDKNAPLRKARLSVRGRTNRTRLSRDAIKKEAGVAGALGVLRGLSQDGPTSVSGALSAEGMDAESHHGTLVDALPGASFGFGGLGITGTGSAGEGGVDGAVGTGDLKTGGPMLGERGAGLAAGGPMSREGRAPSVMRPGRVETRGGLSAEAIRRTVARHRAEVRFCYEQALQGTPDLAGRVTVTFVVAPSGVVQGAQVEGGRTSLGHAGAERCISDAVRRWSFPQPEDGGVVMVTYPFVFQSR